MLQKYNRLAIYCILLVIVVACNPLSASTLPIPKSAPTLMATDIQPTNIEFVIPSSTISEIDIFLSQLNKDGNFSGSVLIGHQGKVLLSQGYGLADREQEISNISETRFRLGSVTKQFTGMAILILQAQDRLDIQDLICDYVFECPPAGEMITIESLLTHTSGIPEFTSMSSYSSLQTTPSSPEETMERFKALPLISQPNERWRYSNSGYIVLGHILEQVSGQTYEAFLQQSIFTPLELRNTGYDHNLSDLAVGYENGSSVQPAAFIDMSIPFSAGALYSTVEDLFQWDRALYTEKLLPQALLNEMFVPRVVIPNRAGEEYGYGWNISEENGRTMISHGGRINGFVSAIVRYPENEIAIIVLSNQQDTNMEMIQDIISIKIFDDR